MLALVAVAAALAYGIELPLGPLTPLQPTLATVIFVLLAHRLRVASWALVVAFPFILFLQSFVVFYMNASTPTDELRQLFSWGGGMLFSPITLVLPLVAGCLVYKLALRLRPNKAMERTGHG